MANCVLRVFQASKSANVEEKAVSPKVYSIFISAGFIFDEKVTIKKTQCLCISFIADAPGRNMLGANSIKEFPNRAATTGAKKKKMIRISRQFEDLSQFQEQRLVKLHKINIE